jgi:S1 RNA binding domain protein
MAMAEEIKIGDIVEAEVIRITDFGAFVKINDRNRGLIHISQISDSFVKDINKHLKVKDKLKAKVIKLGPRNRIDLTLKIKGDGIPVEKRQRDKRSLVSFPRSRSGFKSSDFEEKLNQFLK